MENDKARNIQLFTLYKITRMLNDALYIREDKERELISKNLLYKL